MGSIEPAGITAATLLATKALQAAGGQPGESAWAGMPRLAALVRERVRGHRPAEAALTQLEQSPDDPGRVHALAVALSELAAEDEGLRAALTGLVAEAKQDPAIGTFATQVDGLARVGSIINLAQVQGGVHFHLAPTASPEPVPGSPTTTGGRPQVPTALPGVWNVPYRRNPDFTGREELLGSLAAALASGGGTAAGIQVVHGGGGVGKTTLAAEFAYQQRARFDTVWWVRAEESATLVSDYADLAAALGLAEARQADQQLAVAAVRRWLADHDRWLLVLDNAQDPDTPTGLQVPLARLVDLLPQALHGQVLVTSRDARWDRYAALAELELFTPEEAVAFLLARSGSSDQASAAEVAELLGLLPLALEQAGAYVRETRLPLAAYLERLRQYPVLTVAKGRPRDRDPADTVATTWHVLLDRVRPVPGAVALLEVCTFLSPEQIPRELFATQLDLRAADVGMLADDPFALDEAVAALHRFGLVKAGEQDLTLHRLLQQVIRDRLDLVTSAIRVSTAVELLAEAFPEEGYRDPSVWATCEHLLPHVITATDHVEHPAHQRVDRQEYAVPSRGTLAVSAFLLTRAGGYLYGRGRYLDAEALLTHALRIRHAVYGTAQPDAVTFNYLGLVFHAQGDLDQARAHYERALTIDEAKYGPDHKNTATTLNNLATVLQDQGDLDRARSLHERVLAVYEAQCGPDHPDTALHLNNLADILRAQGDLDAARPLHQRALRIREARLGPDHPTTALSLNNLAGVLYHQDDLAGARALFERALAIYDARLGADHPDTAWSLNNLASVLHAQGDLQGARALYERALAIFEARLGADHPDTVRSRRNLAAVIAELQNRQ